MERPSHAKRPRWLLVTDVDDTLVARKPDGAGERTDVDALLRTLRNSAAVAWAVNSSRPLASVRRTLNGIAVEPDAWIGAMGTEVETVAGPVPGWAERFDGWDRRPVDEVMKRLGFRPHDDEFQTPLKASFEVPRSEWIYVRTALAAAGVRFDVVCSGESDFDVLPRGAGKGRATRFLASFWRVPAERVVAAGDSANDLELFRAAGHGIVVGNARAELRDALAQDHVYFARADRARGILEGLRHFGVLRAAEGRATEDERETSER